jgi:hypothetical protein
MTKLSSLIRKTYSRAVKKCAKHTKVAGKNDLDFPKRQVRLTAQPAKISSSPVSPNSSTNPNRPTPAYTGANGATIPTRDEVQQDILRSPDGLALPSADISSNSSSTSTTAAIDSIPTDLVRNILDLLKPMDIICFGLTEKKMWAAAKSHLLAEGLYPARFVLTDFWGRYVARPTVYVNLPERLQTWMAPRVLFEHSNPRVFVKDQGRANYMQLYYNMVWNELKTHCTPPRVLDLLEYYRPVWVLPECLGLFEKWVHLGVHDYRTCIICCSTIRFVVPNWSKKSGASNSERINRVVQTIVDNVSRLKKSRLKKLGA